MNLYAIEKTKQLESELLNNKRLPPEPPKPRRRAVFGPLAAGAGRTLRRLGEGLESWANPPLREPDRPHTQRERA
jgi:hypothetical protein